MPTESSADEATLALSPSTAHIAAKPRPRPEMAIQQQFPPGLGEPLRNKQAVLAEELVNRQYLAHPELVERYGPVGRETFLHDAQHHLACLAGAMNAGDPELFIHHVAWAKVMLGKRGIPAEHLEHHLEVARIVVNEMLDGEARALAMEYIGSGLARMSAIPAELPTCLDALAPHAELAREYLNALLRGERHLASQYILNAVSKGVTVKDMYLHVFQPTQYELGRLWQLNELSVAQEHYCTAATQLIMSQLYPHVFASEKDKGTLVSACVAGDLHEIGLRMVTDFFEMDGWNTIYLGASMPAQAVVETVMQRKAQILCISATIISHLGAVQELIHRVRADAACRNVTILVGGYLFQDVPELWQAMNSDGCASNAQEAITLANRLIARRGRHGSA